MPKGSIGRVRPARPVFAKKMSWLVRRASSADLVLRHLNTDGNGDDGGGNIDGLRTNRMKAPRSNSKGTADNTDRDNSHIHSSPGSHSRSTPGTQIRSRPTHLRQSAVPKQKRTRLPPIQLREVVSSSYFTSQSIKQRVRRKVARFIPEIKSWDNQ